MSKPTILSRLEFLVVLRKAVAAESSMSAYARRTYITKAYLSDVLRGRRDPGPSVLAPLGFVKEPQPALSYRKRI